MKAAGIAEGLKNIRALITRIFDTFVASVRRVMGLPVRMPLTQKKKPRLHYVNPYSEYVRKELKRRG